MKTILVGAGGSGKDLLRERMQKRGGRFAVTHTTRPRRPGEVDGVDCNFITNHTFLEYSRVEAFIESAEFNNWRYGTLRTTWDSSNLFIMSPEGLRRLDRLRDECFVIYIDIDREIRRERLLARDMPGDKVERRLLADDLDFSDFRNFDMRVTNPLF